MGWAAATAQVMGWLKSFSVVPFWLHVSFITGSSSSLFPWTTLRLKRCVPCFVEDPMWSVLSDPPTLGSTARDNRLEKKLPFLCWVYKHLFSFFFFFFLQNCSTQEVVAVKAGKETKDFLLRLRLFSTRYQRSICSLGPSSHVLVTESECKATKVIYLRAK